MRLVLKKSGSAVRWVVEKTEAEIARETGLRAGSESEGGRGESPLLAQRAREKWGTQCDQEPDNQCDQERGPQGDERCGQGPEENAGRGGWIPWLCAVADPQEKWWERLRGNPKRAGEISQAAFLLKAETLGFDLALPWGDNQKFDFVVWRRDGKAFRVQVKGTGRLHRRGYEVQPVHSTRGGGKKRYTKKDIDVIAAHVQPVDAWYLIPIEKVGRAKSLRLYPGIEGMVKNFKLRRVGKTRRRQRTRVWEQWRDRWEVLGER